LECAIFFLKKNVLIMIWRPANLEEMSLSDHQH